MKTLIRPFKKTIVFLIAFTVDVSCISEKIEPQIDCSTSPVEITLFEKTDTDCGVPSGSISVSASGGDAPYTFSFDANQNTTGEFTNVGAGNYQVIATDAKGCSDAINVTIANLSGVNLEQIISTDAGCGSGNGSIQVQVSGGEEPYTFKLNGGSAQQVNTFSGLDHGQYTVTVTDDSGCETSETVVLKSGVSYEASIKQIIANSCAISGCHSGSVSPDLRSFASIQANAGRIKARTANRSMPRGSSLSSSQIDLIACWVDDGAREN